MHAAYVAHTCDEPLKIKKNPQVLVTLNFTLWEKIFFFENHSHGLSVICLVVPRLIIRV